MNKHNVSLNSLRMFEAAARHLSFTAAALELNVSQAAVSQQMRTLEAQLGVKLFTRRARKLAITPAGDDLAVATRTALLSINQSLDRIRGTSESSTLTVTTLSSFASHWLVPRVDAFQRTHPDMELHVHTSDDPVDLLGGRIDAALRLAATPRDGLVTEFLMPEGFCLVAAPAIAERIEKDPDNLYEFTLNLDSSQLADSQPKDMTDAATDSSLAELNLDPIRLKTRIFSSSEYVVISALGGNSLALTRLSLCVDALDNGQLCIVSGHCKPLDQGTSLVYPELKQDDANLGKFRKWVLDEAADFTSRLQTYLT